jgi:hypothetical protein
VTPPAAGNLLGATSGVQVTSDLLLATVTFAAPPTSGSAWCAATELAADTLAPLVGRSMDLNVTPGSTGSYALPPISFDEFPAIQTTGAPTVQFAGKLHIWESPCNRRAGAPPTHSVDITPFCAWRQLSGSWRSCRGLDR